MDQLIAMLVSVHSFWRYIVMLAAVIGLVVAIGIWLGRLSLSPRLPGTIYIAALDAQVLIGILLLIGGAGAALPGALKFEHPTTMVLAAIVGHVGLVMARRSAEVKRSALVVTISIVVSLALVLVGIMRVTQGR